MRAFHIGDVLSVTTGLLLSPSGIRGLSSLLSYLHGVDIYTYQIPRAMDDARPFIVEAYPELQNVDHSTVDEHNFAAFLADQVLRFGEYLSLNPIPGNEALAREPVLEAIEMVGRERVVALTLEQSK